MPRNQLPRFVIYQPNQKEFHICLEVGSKFLCWLSNYPPTLDIRFSREIRRIADIPANKLPKQKVFDRGTYAITKSDTKEIAEKKLAEGIERKSFPFILNGKKLNGRFSFKKISSGTVIQKYKDKYAVEEDILSGDLSRTISTMIPDYDEKKIQIDYKKIKKTPISNEEAVEEITADKKIGSTDYHFAFYTSDNEPDICLVTSSNGNVLVLRKKRNEWEIADFAPKTILKKRKEFTEYSRKLYNLEE